MAQNNTLKEAIRTAIKENGNNEITGALLQQVLLSMVNSLGVGYMYMGMATPSTNPGTPDQNVFYFAIEAGTYSNFGGIVLSGQEFATLYWDGGWHLDIVPIAGPFTFGAGAYSARLAGTGAEARGDYSTALGNGTISGGKSSLAEGQETKSWGEGSHAEGHYSQSEGKYSHAEGQSQAHKDYSHSEGQSTDCHGNSGHTEGFVTSVAGDYGHAEGDGGHGSEIAIVSINGNVFTLSSVDGLTTDSVLKYDEFYYRIISINTSANTVTVDKQITASTWDTATRMCYGVAYGTSSHVEGRHGVAFGTNSHVEGNENIAIGDNSHAEGEANITKGRCSHAEGVATTTNNEAEHAEGSFNVSHNGNTRAEKTLHSVGIGTGLNDYKNAFEIMQNGDIYVIGIGGYDGTNPSGAQTVKQVMDSRESITNKTTSLSSESTDQQYPSAKAVYDFVMDKLGDIETLLAAI